MSCILQASTSLQGRIVYTPPPHPWENPSRGGGCIKEGGAYKIRATKNPPKYFPVFARVRMQAPYVFVQKIKSPSIFSRMHWFCDGGYVFCASQTIAAIPRSGVSHRPYRSKGSLQGDRGIEFYSGVFGLSCYSGYRTGLNRKKHDSGPLSVCLLYHGRTLHSVTPFTRSIKRQSLQLRIFLADLDPSQGQTGQSSKTM